MESEFNKVCCFIDGWNLPNMCALKLFHVLDRMLLPAADAQYRLKLAEEYKIQVLYLEYSLVLEYLPALNS